MSDLILASGSPRRVEILRQLGVSFSQVPADVDETPALHEAPRAYVLRIARAKASAVAHRSPPEVPVLAADTAVVIGGVILGKPADREDARKMLRRLSGEWHEVHSGVAVLHHHTREVCVTTRVKFRALTTPEIDTYWDSGEPCDKAGAYAIQGIGGAFVERIDGSYSNVVGLPMVETIALLDDFGVRQRFGRSAACKGRRVSPG